MFRCYAWRCSGLILFFRKIFIVRIPFWEWEWLNEGLSSSYLRISFYSHLTLLILKIIFAVFFLLDAIWSDLCAIVIRRSFKNEYLFVSPNFKRTAGYVTSKSFCLFVGGIFNIESCTLFRYIII